MYVYVYMFVCFYVWIFLCMHLCLFLHMFACYILYRRKNGRPHEDVHKMINLKIKYPSTNPKERIHIIWERKKNYM